MPGPLSGHTIAFLVAPEGVEQVELTQPWNAVKQAGATPWLVSTGGGDIQAFHHLDRGDTFPVNATVDNTDPSDFAGLVLPGGVANPDFLRTQATAVDFVRAFAQSGTPIAAICHAPWTLVEAGVLRGRTLTSWPSLRTDIENAGGTWVDKEVVVDDSGAGRLVTSRKPDDLKAFSEHAIEAFTPSR